VVRLLLEEDAEADSKDNCVEHHYPMQLKGTRNGGKAAVGAEQYPS